MTKTPDAMEIGDAFFKRWIRLEGVKEQFERAKLFFKEGSQSTDRLDKYRRFVAAIYFSRAIVELMLECADRQEVSVKREELRDMLAGKLPRYMLVERLRIHDYHRFGLVDRPGGMMMGPIKLTASKGLAQVQYTKTGRREHTTGGSKVKEQRPVRVQDGMILDEDAGQYVSLETILCDYLAAVPEVIEEFSKLRA